MTDLSVNFQIDFDGLDKLDQQSTARASAVVRKATHDAVANYQVSMVGPKSGKEYKRGKKPNQKLHQASAPGEAPAKDEGQLSSSARPNFPDPLTGIIEVSAAHGVMQELGTTKIAARPALRPAVEKVRDSLVAGLSKAVSG